MTNKKGLKQKEIMGKSPTAEYRVRETEINENNVIMTERMCKRKKITKE